MSASTAFRVAENTAEEINAGIRRRTEERIAYYAAHPDEIDARLEALDAEWDIERCLETGAASLGLFGLAMGLASGRRWLLLPAVVAGFLLQHAVQGWCPPIVPLRRAGVRTPREIDIERIALKTMRGDFDGLPPMVGAADKLMQAVER